MHPQVAPRLRVDCVVLELNVAILMQGRFGMSDHLQQQIEEIIDTGSGPTRDVIIRMGDLDREIKDLIPAASEAIRRRILSQSARELLPVRSGTLQRSREAKITPAQRRELRAAESSFTAQAARHLVPVVARAALRAMASRPSHRWSNPISSAMP
jgi:hypothetical protein